MSIFKNSSVWRKIIKGFLVSLTTVLFFAVFTGVYYLGFLKGYDSGILEVREFYSFDREKESAEVFVPTPVPTKKPVVKTVSPKISWGGPELWEEVNKKRVENGVSQLAQRDELCTIASIRLNELLDLDNLDGHEGFGTMSEDRPDLAWIFQKYSVVAEFLAMGGETPQETVSLWENTLGHRKLLDGGEFVWGCIYAQDSFAVAITAY